MRTNLSKIYSKIKHLGIKIKQYGNEIKITTLIVDVIALVDSHKDFIIDLITNLF